MTLANSMARPREFSSHVTDYQSVNYVSHDLPYFPTCPHRSHKKTQFQTVEGLNLSRYIPKRTCPLTQQFCLVQISNMFLAYIYIYIYTHTLLWRFPKGVPQNELFLRENPSINGWFGGTPISGNHHVYVYIYLFIYIYTYISIQYIYIYVYIR